MQGSRAEVDVAIVDRPMVINSPIELVGASLRALSNRELSFNVANAVRSGELWTASWRWWENRPHASVSLAVPRFGGLPGILRFVCSWEEQSYGFGTSGTVVQPSRRRAGLSVSDWANADLRWEGTLSLDHWDERGSYASFGGAVERRFHGDRLALRADAEGWFGPASASPFAAGGLSAKWRSATSRRGTLWLGRLGFKAASRDAPLDLWSGAGVGHARSPLLRAHPLLQEGIIDVEGAVFGRYLAHGGVEFQEWFAAKGPARWGVALFADVARAWQPGPGISAGPAELDVGAGLRLHLLGQVGQLRTMRRAVFATVPSHCRWVGSWTGRLVIRERKRTMGSVGSRQLILSLGGLAWVASGIPAEAREQSEPASTSQSPAQTEDSADLPETREEALRRKRQEKSENPEPYLPNKVEENLIRFDKAETPTIQETNFHGFYPRAAWIARGSGISFGTRYWKRDVGGTPLDLAGSVFYSIHGYQHYDVQFGLIPESRPAIAKSSLERRRALPVGEPEKARHAPVHYLRCTFRYRYLPQTLYFGIGPESELEDGSNYLLRSTAFYVRNGYQFGDHVSVTLNGGYWKYSLGEGTKSSVPTTQEVYNNFTAPGLSNPPSYLRYGVNALLDFRDEPGNPHKGLVVAGVVTRWDDQTEESFNFNSFMLDARGFIPLGTRQRVLPLRSALVIQEADARNRIPFFLQPSLGGSHTLRGFNSFRFQGPKAMLYQLEYRWEANQIWELALFADTGTVSAPRGDLDFSTLK